MNPSALDDVVHWAARIGSLLFFVLIAVFVVGHASAPEGLPNLWRAPLDVQLDFLALFLMVVGGVVGWKSPPAAAVMLLIGYALWQLVERRMPWPPSIIEIPLAIGLLYAFRWWCAKRLLPRQQHGMS